MKVVVIIPTYNEKINIEKLIPILENGVFPQVKKHEMEILVADDKSPDGTAAVVEHMQKKWKNIHLLEGNKEGLGAAYARAMRYAMDKMHADAVIELDADFQHDPHDIPRLIEEMDNGYDYVIGSRYIPGGKIPSEWGWYRKFISYYGGSVFGRLVLWIRNIHDITSGYKLTRTTYLSKVDLEHLYSKYYAYKIHILYDIVKRGAKVKEIPIVFYERKEGSSKIERKDLFDSFYVVLKLRAKRSKRIIKFLFTGGMGFVIQVVMQEAMIYSGIAHQLALVFHPSLHSVLPTDVKNLTDAIAAAFGAEAAILWNYTINNFWTFDDTRALKGNRGFFGRLIKFNIASCASIFIQFLAVFIAERIFGIYVDIGGYMIPVRILVLFPAIILFVIPLNYLIYNRVIWKTQRLKKDHGKNPEA